MRRLILAIATLLSCCTPAVAPAQRSDTGLVMLAVTRWNCAQARPHVYVDTELDTSVWRPVVLAHEAVHVQQGLAAGSCAAYNAGLTRPGSLLDDELPAYCAGARKAVQLGLRPSLDFALMEGALVLSRIPALHLDIKQAFQLLRGTCGRAAAPP